MACEEKVESSENGPVAKRQCFRLLESVSDGSRRVTEGSLLISETSPDIALRQRSAQAAAVKTSGAGVTMVAVKKKGFPARPVRSSAATGTQVIVRDVIYLSS